MMNLAKCLLAAIPMRLEPSDKSELVNQMLFGEIATIEDENEKWYMVRLHHDNYIGWIDKKQLSRIAETERTESINKRALHEFSTSHALPSWIPGGALLTPKEISMVAQSNVRLSIEETAMLFLGSPYLWGGRTCMGIDCSGFTQIVFRMSGISLQRDANQQATQGEMVNFVQEAMTGDLAFFDNAEGRITHVGIIIKNMVDSTMNIIHSSGQVKIDPLDHQGIYVAESGTYSHNLRMIRRVS